jgi:alanyl-tRNA synthetase
MTRRDYYFIDATEADTYIVSCEESEDRWIVKLERTIFHPRGGGQLADTGWLNDCPVLAVELHGEAIHHIVGRPLGLGPVRQRLHADTRSLHTRLHSAGHLIGHAGIAQGLMPSKAQHWPGESRVVFQCENSQCIDLAAMASAIEKLIEQDLVRSCEIRNGQRMIGFGELSAFPCGGTHVRSLAEIGAIRLLDVKRRQNQLSVSYELCATNSSTLI